MRRWTAAQAEDSVKDAIARAGRGGGYILSDAHGEIPIHVPEDILLAISAAVHEWDPLTWREDDAIAPLDGPGSPGEADRAVLSWPRRSCGLRPGVGRVVAGVATE